MIAILLILLGIVCSGATFIVCSFWSRLRDLTSMSNAQIERSNTMVEVLSKINYILSNIVQSGNSAEKFGLTGFTQEK